MIKETLYRLFIGCVIIVAALAIRPTLMPYGQMKLRDIKTTSRWETLTPEKFRGCPNFFHRVQGPWTIKVDPIWSDQMEQAFKIHMEKNAFQREHAS